MINVRQYFEFITVCWKFMKKYLEQSPINWDEYHEERVLITEQYGDKGFYKDIMVAVLTEIERVKA